MLTPQHWNTLRAMMNRIIPADEYPGAWDAGVGDFLERQFELDWRLQLDVYRLGLEALEAEALAAAGTGFTGLEATAQDAILGRLESGRVTVSWPVDPAGFFRTVTEHVMAGFYGNPGNGGNRGSIAWRMIGFETRE